MNNWINICYILLPLILAGVSNMIFVKINFLGFLKIPIDRNVTLKDGKRLFGDNKTWKGFFGMILFTAFWTSVLVFFIPDALNFVFTVIEKNALSVFILGAFLGFAYVLFELPNSYIKRRLSIEPGKSGKGFLKYLFMLVDQADSVLGCALVLYFLYAISLSLTIQLIIIGTLVHYIINVILFFVKLKSQPA